MEKWSVSAQSLEQRSFKKLGFTNIYESLVLILLYGVKYLRVLPLDKNNRPKRPINKEQADSVKVWTNANYLQKEWEKRSII